MSPRPSLSEPCPPLDLEDGFLLAALRAYLGQAVARPDPERVDWAEFVRRVRRHGLQSILFPVLEGWFGADMPPGVADGLRRAIRQQAPYTAQLAKALREIDPVLQGAGTDYLVLKGLPLGQATYGSITARPSRDVDILVAPSDFERARRALGGAGFASDWDLSDAQEAVCLRYSPDLPLRGRDGVLVELHGRLDLPFARADAFARSLLASAVSCPAGLTEVPAVVGAPALPYLAAHGANHAWMRLFWLLDAAVITAAAGAHELEAAWHDAEHHGAEIWLALTWRLCEDLLGVSVPEPARRAAASTEVSGLAGRVREQALGSVGRAPIGSAERRVEGLSWSLALARGPARRARLLLRYLSAVGPDDVRALPLPDSLTWAYPVFRPVRIVTRLASAALARLRGRGS